MPVFSSPVFIGLVGLCYILGQFTTPLHRTTVFGLLNALAVGILFGRRALLALLAISAVYWAILALVNFLKRKNIQRKGISVLPSLAAPILYVSVAALFLLHKSLLEPSHSFMSLYIFRSIAFLANRPPVHSAIHLFQLLALSYIALRLIDFIRSVLDGDPLLNPLALSGYLVPFFMTPAGPVNAYTEHLTMDKAPAPQPSAASFIDSCFLIVSGYFLKFVVAQLFSILITGLNGAWPTTTLLDTTRFLVYVFFEFAGYSLIALGVGRLLGVPTPVNFNHPYVATSVGEFWNRWHMSLGSFVRRNLYTPVQVALMRRFGRKNRNVAYVTNILAVWLPFVLVGLWHRFTWHFLLWGFAVGAMVAAEKVIRDKIPPALKKWPGSRRWIAAVGVSYTLAFVIVTLHIATRDFIQP